MAAAYREELLEKLSQRSATVAVVGLGYAGLPLACALAEAGHRVIGIDLSLEKVEGINAGLSHVEDVPPSQIKRLVDSGVCGRATNTRAPATPTSRSSPFPRLSTNTVFPI
jgi:UDP-N-acetyl-D-glucosamine dehydrogenase